MMRRFFAALLLCLPMPLQAETLLVEYYTSLEPQDAYNSRGQPINDFCAIVQQDRANMHRFGRPGPSDSGDFYFTTPERRALITNRCVYDPGYYANAGNRIRNGTRQYYVWVRVFEQGGRVTRIFVSEGAG